MKGCPLSCIWCHNPESKYEKAELAFDPMRCIGCGKSKSACPQGCHSFTPSAHRIDRSSCISCGACTEVCIGALEIIGELRSAEDVIAEACKDKIFTRLRAEELPSAAESPLPNPTFFSRC